MSESTFIPVDIYKDLKSRFTHIIPLFDRDNTGVFWSYRYKWEYDNNIISILPYVNSDKKLKDIAEISKECGLSYLNKITKDVIASI
jgi:hypothetical protein